MGSFLAASKLKEVVPGLTQSCNSTTNKNSKYTIEMLSHSLREQVIRYDANLNLNRISCTLDVPYNSAFQNHLYEFLRKRRTGAANQCYLC